MENKHLKPLLHYLRVIEEFCENADPDECALTSGYYDVTCGELRVALAEIERLQNSGRSYAADYEAAMAKLSTATSERDEAKHRAHVWKQAAKNHRFWRQYWEDAVQAREKWLLETVNERDQARRWAAKLHLAASKAKKLIRRQGELNSSGWKEPASPPWPEWLPALTASAYRILDAATGGNE